jgi:hypothetical protein
MNHDSDDRTRGAPTPMCSRRSFMRVAATSGGAGLLSAGLLPMIVQARVGSPSQVVLPPATPEIAPFKVQVPQAVLEDLIQGTRPQTLGYGLADSPVGQAMWIYEKFQGWTDNKGDPEHLPRPYVGRHHTLLVDQHRRIFGADLLREFQKGFRPNAARGSYCSQHLQGRHVHATEGVGRANLLETLLLERGPQRRSFRSAGAASVVR